MRIHSETPFTLEQVERVAASLDQLALAIDNQLLLASTQNRLQETNTLLEIAAIAASVRGLDDMLRQVLELCRQILSVKAGALLLVNENTGRLEYQSGSGAFGFEDEYRSLSISTRTNEPNNIIVQVFAGGEPAFVNSPEKLSPQLQEIARTHELENLLVAPLRVHEHQLGVFLVAGKPDGFTYSDAGLLVAMSSHISAALRNAQLLEHTRARLSETEILQRIAAITSATQDLAEMLTAALDKTADMFAAEGAQLLLLDSAGNNLVPHEISRYGVMKTWSTTPLSLENTDHHQVRVFHSDEAYLTNDPLAASEPPHYHMLSVPLTTGQGAIGVMTIIRKKTEFDTGHGKLALAIGSQVATGLQSNQLFARERRRAEMMLLINRVSQELTATLDIRNLMNKFVSNVRDTLGYDTVYVFLMDESGKNLVCEASATGDPAHRTPEGFTLPVEQGMIGRTAREQKSFLVPDISEDPDYILFEESHRVLKSALIVPIKHAKAIYGVIELLGLEPKAFDTTDMIAMESLAAQISVAVDNARLYDQARRRLLEQSIVHQIGQDLIAILEYNELVRAVAQHMARALDSSSCSVAIYDVNRERIRIEADYRIPRS